ncbi:MAG: SGNH/GDSL hydrolase family protein, partial [Alicyclobacillus sp.]|nr:SGNH/GDSL hydrolase family protein [Alicyclobacillus sp.]
KNVLRSGRRIVAAASLVMASTVAVVHARTADKLAYAAWWPWRNEHWQHKAPFEIRGSQHASTSGSAAPIRVLIVGGSIAAGWCDAPGHSYLTRALAAYAEQSGGTFEVYQRAVPGARVAGTPQRYVQWLKDIRPQVVILSWGLLNDCYAGTPPARIRTAVKDQIQAARAYHAAVWLVTPPVSAASYTVYRRQQATYVSEELAVAASLHDANVHAFDLFDEMKRYLEQRHDSYRKLMADHWHPNSAGHELAGQLLAHDMVRTLGPTLVTTAASGGQALDDLSVLPRLE